MKFFFGFLVVMSSLSYSAQYDESRAIMLGFSCTSCHGTNGKSSSIFMPTIAGMDKNVMLAMLKAFKSDLIDNTMMGKSTRGFNDEELEQISFYFSKQ